MTVTVPSYMPYSTMNPQQDERGPCSTPAPSATLRDCLQHYFDTDNWDISTTYTNVAAAAAAAADAASSAHATSVWSALLLCHCYFKSYFSVHTLTLLNALRPCFVAPLAPNLESVLYNNPPT